MSGGDVYLAKFDAEARRASGRPIPEEIAPLLGDLIAESTSAGEVLDICEAAGIPKPQLDSLTPKFLDRMRAVENAQLAMWWGGGSRVSCLSVLRGSRPVNPPR